jgi:HPt (histidine-containing phosphotransfer) domain-containing protein
MSAHWDHATALDRLGNDGPLLQKLVDVFFQEYHKLSGRLRHALARGDLTATGEIAHSLKGSAAYTGFSDAAKLALETENASRAEDDVKTSGCAGR